MNSILEGSWNRWVWMWPKNIEIWKSNFQWRRNLCYRAYN